MARPRTEFSSTLSAEIEARAQRGENARTIAAALGQPKLQQTINRRLKERGKLPEAKSSHARNAEIPDKPASDTPLAELDQWIATLSRAATNAEAQGNLGALASIAAKVTTLMALRHKTTPLPAPDANDDPDFELLAQQGEDRLLTLIKGIFATP